MVKRVVIGRSGEEKIVDLIKALDERATAGNTSPSGNKVLEYDEDIFWTHDDGREISVRQVEETLSDAEDRITDAEFALQDSVLAAEEAKSIAEQTQIDLDRVETEVIPGAVADLEAAATEAAEDLAELEVKVGQAETELEQAKGNLTQLETDLATEQSAREQLGDDMQGTFTTLDGKLATLDGVVEGKPDFDDLTVGNLLAGTVTTPEAVIEKIWADGVAAKSIATNRLYVGGGSELAFNPFFDNEGAEWRIPDAGPGSGFSPDAALDGHAMGAVVMPYTSGSSTLYGPMCGGGSSYPGERIAVEPGETYHIYSWVRRTEGFIDNIGNLHTRVYAYPGVSTGSNSNGLAGSSMSAADLPPMEWVKIGGTYTVPTDRSFITPRFTAYPISGTTWPASGAAVWHVGGYSVVKRVGSVLIEDGAVGADQVNAESVAASVGQFVKAEVGNLVATKGTIGTAVIDKIWADGISAKAITAGKIIVGDAGVSEWSWVSDEGLGDWASPRSGWSRAGTEMHYNGSASSEYDSRLYGNYLPTPPGVVWRIQVDVTNRDKHDATVPIGGYRGTASGAYSSSIWPPASPFTLPPGRHTLSVDVPVGELASGESTFSPIMYFRDSSGSAASGRSVIVHSIRVTRDMPLSSVLIEDGAVKAEHITASESLSANIVNSMTVNTKKLVVTEEAVLQHAKLLGTTIVEDINVTGKLIGKDGVFTGTVDFANINVTGTQIVNKLGANSISAEKISGGSFSGKTFSGGLFKGTRVEATNSSGQGAILVPDTTAGSGGLFFSDNGGVSGSQAAIYRGSGGGSKLSADLTLRPAAGGAVIAHSRLECTGTIASGSSVTVASDVIVGGGGLSTGSQMVSTPRADIGYIQLRGDMNTAGTTKIANYGRLEQHGSRVYMHNLTSTSSTGNLVISNSSKRIYHGVSSRRYKRNIVDWNPEAKRVLALQPRQWQHDDPTSDEIDETWYVGFIAEEVDELGLKKLVQYVGDGKGGWIPEALNYDRFAAAQQIVLRKHEAEIQELRERIALLESK